MKEIINKYISTVDSHSYQKFVKRYPAGKSWTDYRIDFRNNVVSEFSQCSPIAATRKLTKTGAISSPVSFSSDIIGEYAINWHVSRLRQKHSGLNIQNFYPSVEEVKFFEGNAVKPLEDGRRFSLDTFRYLGYIEKIEKHLTEIKSIKYYLELGSGNGGFARTIKLLNPNANCILVDLPEVLFTSFNFLSICFPKANHKFIENKEDLKKAISTKFDFIYLSHHLFEKENFSEFKIDLFCNMRSLGEMTAKVTSHYNKIISNLLIKNIFLENRYLNTYSPLKRNLMNFRKNEITGSTWMKDTWNTIDFDFEPEWAQSPYESDHPRYLALCLKQEKLSQPFIKNPEKAISQIKKQYWYDKHEFVRPWNMAYHPLNVDEDTLCILWELCRKNTTRESLELILHFITYHFKNRNVEEYDYYFQLLKEKFGVKFKMRKRNNLFFMSRRLKRSVANLFGIWFKRKFSSQFLESK